MLAAASAGAAGIHFVVAGQHMEVDALHGAFFITVAWAQAAWAGLILFRPSRLIVAAGAAGNALVAGVWLMSRTVGLPIGATAGIREPIGPPDAVATIFEFLVVGIGLVAAAKWRPRATLAPRRVAAIGALLVAGVAGLASAALALGGGDHPHPGLALGSSHASGVAQGTVGSDHHSGSAIAEDDPVLLRLEAAVERNGTRAGIDVLEDLAAKDPQIERTAHQYIHALGRYVYEQSDDPGTAFSSCDQRFEAGCYHGVLQGYFEDNPNFTAEDVASLCQGPIQAGASTNLTFQCIHGLGHGLTLFFDHELKEPLRYCDALATDWQRRSCYGGVFMEIIVFAISPLGQDEGLLAPNDPHYPCNVVGERYRWDCYLLQSSVMLYLNGYDFAEAFAACDRAGEPYTAACYQSMGRDISGYTVRDIEESKELCLLGQPSHQPDCFDGVVRNLVGVNWSTETGFAFCQLVPVDGKERCYRAIGELVQTFTSDLSERAEECAGAEDPQWEAVCRAGAGLAA